MRSHVRNSYSESHESGRGFGRSCSEGRLVDIGAPRRFKPSVIPCKADDQSCVVWTGFVLFTVLAAQLLLLSVQLSPR